MKKLLQILITVLFVLLAFISVCFVADMATKIKFSLNSNIICAAVLMVLSVVTAVLSVAVKTPVNKGFAVLSAFLLPLIIADGIYFVLNDSWQLSGLFTLVCAVCMIIVLVNKAKPFVLKIVTGIISVIPCLLFLVLFFASALFWDFSYNRVVKSANSPNNTYVAEVVSSDQGALGGNTLVSVKKNININLLICNFTFDSTNVYTGYWGEFENMQIHWQDENTLIINGAKYYIND